MRGALAQCFDISLLQLIRVRTDGCEVVSAWRPVQRIVAFDPLSTLQIDATLNQDFPHNMPYLVSGTPTTNLFPKVSATYSF